MTGSQVLSLGHYRPAKVLTNSDIARIVETSDEWIRARVGISTRHIADPTETVDHMAAVSAERALAAGELTARDIDLVVVATTTATGRSPNTAARVAAALGMRGPATIDVNVACAGFTHALAMADHAVRLGAAEKAVVIGSERMSDVTDWTDRSTCVLVGDGAGAAVVVASEEQHIGPVVWGSVPEMASAVRIEGDPCRFAQEGERVYRWAITALPPIARRVCEASGVALADLGAVILHQANRRMIDAIVRGLDLGDAVVALDVVGSGNTSAASIPLALSRLAESREVPAGVPALLLGFGGGLSYAGQVISFPATRNSGE